MPVHSSDNLLLNNQPECSYLVGRQGGLGCREDVSWQAGSAVEIGAFRGGTVTADEIDHQALTTLMPGPAHPGNRCRVSALICIHRQCTAVGETAAFQANRLRAGRAEHRRCCRRPCLLLPATRGCHERYSQDDHCQTRVGMPH